ncbi:unnamed protein product [Caenorhabditis sp. 36 PRJEB53466]|nr:unnamed protein product [Caenorhabditis sp. 36 PRJEB53466]
MKMFFLFLLASVLGSSQCFDFIRNAFNYVNEMADPCYDFYRHACPKFSARSEMLITRLYNPILQKHLTKQSDNIWENIAIEETLRNIHLNELPAPDDYFLEMFFTRCETGEDTRPLLLMLQELLHEKGQTECFTTGCLLPIADDNNCTRAVAFLGQRIHSLQYDSFKLVAGGLADYLNTLKVYLEGAGIILDANLRDGVSGVKDVVDEIIFTVEEWIEATPWVIKNDVVGPIKAEIEQLNLFDNYAQVLRDDLDALLTLEQNYLTCLRRIGNSEQSEVFCLFYAQQTQTKTPLIHEFYNYLNAGNFHPNLYFSYYFYDLMQNVEELAGVLGSTGIVAGHEVSHTLIENVNRLELIPFFSNESMQCVMNQYERTCDEFRETSCYTADHQIDENGSDILGVQLAYNIFKKEYEGREQDEYIKLRSRVVTYQQLFFYGFAFTFCLNSPMQHSPMDVHAAMNVRINAMANHPAFQEAFQCSDNSRMMSTVKEQCLIFGEGAPETRKF